MRKSARAPPARRRSQDAADRGRRPLVNTRPASTPCESPEGTASARRLSGGSVKGASRRTVRVRAFGWVRCSTGRIAIRRDLAVKAQVLTLAHELVRGRGLAFDAELLFSADAGRLGGGARGRTAGHRCGWRRGCVSRRPCGCLVGLGGVGGAFFGFVGPRGGFRRDGRAAGWCVREERGGSGCRAGLAVQREERQPDGHGSGDPRERGAQRARGVCGALAPRHQERTQRRGQAQRPGRVRCRRCRAPMCCGGVAAAGLRRGPTVCARLAGCARRWAPRPGVVSGPGRGGAWG